MVGTGMDRGGFGDVGLLATSGRVVESEAATDCCVERSRRVGSGMRRREQWLRVGRFRHLESHACGGDNNNHIDAHQPGNSPGPGRSTGDCDDYIDQYSFWIGQVYCDECRTTGIRRSVGRKSGDTTRLSVYRRLSHLCRVLRRLTESTVEIGDRDSDRHRHRLVGNIGRNRDAGAFRADDDLGAVNRI
jgi:hypothetical protein